VQQAIKSQVKQTMALELPKDEEIDTDQGSEPYCVLKRPKRDIIKPKKFKDFISI
jgi:hypothetical protein